jgi:hypothetical protein
MFSNGFGALCTAIVLLVFAVTKFRDGAWVVLILTPILISIFLWIHRHYANVATNLSLEKYGEPPPYNVRHRVLVPISNVHQGTLAALRYARMLSEDITAVHISMEPADTEHVRKTWETWGRGTRLVIVDSPYRQFLEPLLDYINEILSSRNDHHCCTTHSHRPTHDESTPYADSRDASPGITFHTGCCNHRSPLSDSLAMF